MCRDERHANLFSTSVLNPTLAIIIVNNRMSIASTGDFSRSPEEELWGNISGKYCVVWAFMPNAGEALDARAFSN